jgi:hypothetical protein
MKIIGAATEGDEVRINLGTEGLEIVEGVVSSDEQAELT